MMINELNINEHTATLPFSFDAKEGQEQPCIVKYKVSVRRGATAEMINDTIRHFKATVRTLVAGFTEPSADIPDRPSWAEPILHNEARVIVYNCGGLPVQIDDDNVIRYDINVFNEFSTVPVAVAHAWMYIRAIADGDHVSDLISNGKPQNELDTHHDERKPQQQASAPDKSNGGVVAAPKNVVGERQVFERLPKDVREELERESIGQVIGLHVSAVERNLHKWDDGNTEEQIVFWRLDGEYAYNYRTVIKVDDREHNYDLKVFKKTGLLEQLPGAGYKIPINGIAYFKLNKGTGDYADKVYWNFHSFVAGEKQQDELAPEETQDWDDAPPDDYGDIPF